ncbi:phosphonates import ATP-binding protein PhnC 2 [Cupriavidus necator N-1]|jgi:phosphonate transport system ATP-binding protein|uniref:Phosphonates import ATP-binding protein PhnC 2 n=1 Tax=Cupriavidus necator (strain ATCC 43291 / DSM 13513 / CCUG 52238 / LMG 8453 / N-1) TaxID=1042878 RepID=F8GN43_CUPNN|nr:MULTISPECIES: phosphonate ABC transporter ATP-binding protein [Cupriavidus]AEI80231.1 phosphonates import ATP-binding protein PhnC 2 [Cupriavidus necator N-1]KAI3596653.1 Phosphonate ABC transporter ATP-binding protein PhnC [Cupriavidus necator H850]MDX6010138.1 phosphonate ABC transporter ATP-binding protein [Cupriavidus necator]QUN30438.1 phosphonate ABC transporter ATP-binding protein [Cupriavidus sp. KK10]
MTHAIEVRGLSKSFRADRKALDDVTLHIAPGEMVALLGASGSGKSTLLRHVAGFITGDAGAGEILVNGRHVQRNGRLARNVRKVRGEIGFVFQQFNLVGRLPVITNVLVGMLARVPKWRSLLRIFTADEVQGGLDVLAQVGIDDYAFQRASTLSGGQQQRAAIARTLVQNASVILADEPIASLDPESSRRVMSLLRQINRTRKVAVLVSLHQVDVAMRYCPRVVALRHGKVVYDGPSAALTPGMLRDLYGTEADELLHDSVPDEDVSTTAMPAPAMVTMNLAAA